MNIVSQRCIKKILTLFASNFRKAVGFHLITLMLKSRGSQLTGHGNLKKSNETDVSMLDWRAYTLSSLFLIDVAT